MWGRRNAGGVRADKSCHGVPYHTGLVRDGPCSNHNRHQHTCPRGEKLEHLKHWPDLEPGPMKLALDAVVARPLAMQLISSLAESKQWQMCLLPQGYSGIDPRSRSWKSETTEPVTPLVLLPAKDHLLMSTRADEDPGDLHWQGWHMGLNKIGYLW